MKVSNSNTDEQIIDAVFSDDTPGFRELYGIVESSSQKPSYEQQLVIHHLMDGYNVVVDSVSGSGKSTTILAAAEQMPDSQILQLTYNAMLRHEVVEKARKRCLKNIEIHTFHSLAVKYYRKDAHQDIVLRKIIRNNTLPAKTIPKFQFVFLDESQDMTLLYFMFIVKFLRDMGELIQVCILGDYKQGIYQFKGADIRFLTKASQIWSHYSLLRTREFRECSLNTSYRITYPMAHFVNDVMLGETRLKACKSGANVHYVRYPIWDIPKIINGQIFALLRGGSSPGDVFILTASIKQSTIRKIENVLVENGVPCFVAMNEAEQMDEKMVSGKVVFSSFHSVKGRERKHAFVLGFDHSYFTHYAAELPTDTCPNTLYVGCTRATENLYLFEKNGHSTDRPLDFLRKTHFDMMDASYIQFRGNPQKHFQTDCDETSRQLFTDVSPTSLIRFISESVMEEITPVLERIFTTVVEPYPELEIDIPVSQHTAKGFYEDVSDLNGIAIPSMYFDKLSRKSNANSIRDFVSPENCGLSTSYGLHKSLNSSPGVNILLAQINAVLEETRPGDYAFLKKCIAEIPTTISTPAEYLYLANLYVAVREKLYYKLKQIEKDDYGWLTPEILEQCFDRLDDTIGVEPDFPLIEYAIIDHSMELETDRARQVLTPYFVGYAKQFRFTAVVDCLTKTTLWELKCTSVLSTEHQIQVAIYAWLWRIVSPDSPREVRLFNVRTGEIQRLDATFDDLTTIMVALLKGKYDKPEEKPDDVFLAECQGVAESIGRSKSAIFGRDEVSYENQGVAESVGRSKSANSGERSL